MPATAKAAEREAEPKHTPGPWHVVIGRMKEGDPAFGFGVFPDKPTLPNLPEDARQHSLASGNFYEHSAFSAFYKPEEIEANASLIAAAPDMRDSLDPDTLEAIADEIDCFEHSARAGSLRGIAKRQRAALAKTEGRS